MAHDTDGKEKTNSAEHDQSFNDAELEDIMSEIENLEKEFEDDINESEALNAAEIVDEEALSDTTDDIEEDDMNVTSATVTSLHRMEDSKKKLASSNSSKISQSTGHQIGKMNLSMNFEIAGELATVVIDEAEGISFEYKGSLININGENGFTIDLQGGVKLSIPVGDTTAHKAKKAS